MAGAGGGSTEAGAKGPVRSGGPGGAALVPEGTVRVGSSAIGAPGLAGRGRVQPMIPDPDAPGLPPGRRSAAEFASLGWIEGALPRPIAGGYATLRTVGSSDTAIRGLIGMSSEPTSLTLVDRVRTRDEDAWKRLVGLYSPLVLYWCGRWGVRGEDARDVVQEVFQAVAAGIADFRRDRPGDTFRGWLRGVTRNKVLMHF